MVDLDIMNERAVRNSMQSFKVANEKGVSFLVKEYSEEEQRFPSSGCHPLLAAYPAAAAATTWFDAGTLVMTPRGARNKSWRSAIMRFLRCLETRDPEKEEYGIDEIFLKHMSPMDGTPERSDVHVVTPRDEWFDQCEFPDKAARAKGAPSAQELENKVEAILGAKAGIEHCKSATAPAITEMPLYLTNLL